MDFQKDNFEDDNELSRLEEEDELGGDGDEVVETEEEGLIITEEEPVAVPAPRAAPKPAASKPAKKKAAPKKAKKKAKRARPKAKKKTALTDFSLSFPGSGKGLGGRPGLFYLRTTSFQTGTRPPRRCSQLRIEPLSIWELPLVIWPNGLPE